MSPFPKQSIASNAPASTPPERSAVEPGRTGLELSGSAGRIGLLCIDGCEPPDADTALAQREAAAAAAVQARRNAEAASDIAVDAAFGSES